MLNPIKVIVEYYGKLYEGKEVKIELYPNGYGEIKVEKYHQGDTYYHIIQAFYEWKQWEKHADEIMQNMS
jgi:hypothetical protein